MTARTFEISGSRSLVLGSLEGSVNFSLQRPFVALVPAFDIGERHKVEAMAGTLLELGCMEFCCVGPQAEQLHDSLDEIIEVRGALEVVTTWHTDYSDACEYFLFAAGGKPRTLLALVSPHPELAALLKKESEST
jgi:hypothetical protein